MALTTKTFLLNQVHHFILLLVNLRLIWNVYAFLDTVFQSVISWQRFSPQTFFCCISNDRNLHNWVIFGFCAWQHFYPRFLEKNVILFLRFLWNNYLTNFCKLMSGKLMLGARKLVAQWIKMSMFFIMIKVVPLGKRHTHNWEWFGIFFQQFYYHSILIYQGRIKIW